MNPVLEILDFGSDTVQGSARRGYWGGGGLTQGHSNLG